MKFATKVALMPGLAALGFLVVLVVSAVVGVTNGHLILGIQQGSLAAVDASRDLEETLAEVQRGLQSAVAEANKELLATKTDPLRDHFNSVVARLRLTPGGPQENLSAIGRDFNDYYGLARQAVQQMIGGTVSEQL